MSRLILFLLLLTSGLRAQINFDQQNIDLGTITEAYDIKGDIVVTNISGKKIFLLRADADPGVKVYTSKKTLQAFDTCLLVISFSPESSGKFKKKINLISSDQSTPYVITLSGNLLNLKVNDRMACVYFGKRQNNSITVKQEPVTVPETTVVRDNSNKLPGSSPTTPKKNNVTKPILKEPVLNKPQLDDHKPNAILFLVDVSSSMRDSMKLPLMKNALHKLIDAVRAIDSISFVSYASKVTVIKEAVCGSDKQTLHAIVDSLKAKGMTAGYKAILMSQEISQKHFIYNGNNQIILATDGEFKMTPENFKLWKEKQGEKKIILTTVAFGEDKKALKNLKDIAQKGNGSFIHINRKQGSDEKLLNEIEMRSRIQ